MKPSLLTFSSRRLVIRNPVSRPFSHHFSTSPTSNSSGFYFYPQISESITAAITTHGIKGPVQMITAFGDVIQEALSATCVILTHVPRDFTGFVKETQKQVQDSSPLAEKVSSDEFIAGQLFPAEESCPTPEERIWSNWFSGKEDAEVNNRDNVEKRFSPRNNTKKIKHKVKCVESTGTSPDPVGPSTFSSTSKKAGSKQVQDSSTSSADQASTVSSKKSSGDISCKGAGGEKPSIPSSSKSTERQELTKEVNETQKQVQDASPLAEKVSNEEFIASQLCPAEKSCPPPEEGFLKRIWSKWFGGKEDAEVKNGDNIEQRFTPRDISKKIKHEVNCVESTGTSPDPVGLSASSKKAGLTSSSSSSTEIIMDKDINSSSEIIDDKSIGRPGTESLNDEFCGKKKDRSIDLEMQEVFSESLWNDILTFLKTPKGLDSILQARTRKEMVQNLQKHGPPSLMSLREHNLLELVELLVSDKHWVEESPTHAFPFKLVLPAGKSSQNSSGSSKDLSSISDPQSKLGSQLEQPERDEEKRCHSPPHSQVPSNVTPNKPSNESRSQVLGDCQKLVSELLKKYPDGFNNGVFRKAFKDKYGYSLDLQKLGYPKLKTLLQLIPGVNIDGGSILPPGRVSKSTSTEVTDPTVIQGRKGPKSNRKSSRKAKDDIDPKNRRKDDIDDPDSPWEEELGPVITNSSPKQNNEMKGSSRKVKQESVAPEMLHEYVSDSEKEMLSTTGGSEGQGKPREKEENSYLLQVLDSWNSAKDNRRIVASASASASECAEPSSMHGIIKNKNAVKVNFVQKQRAARVSFVADNPGDHKDS